LPSIRHATLRDARAIERILQEAFIEYRDRYTPEAFAATTPAAPEVMRRLNEGPVWIAFAAETAAGTVSAVVKDAELYVRGMAVVPAARGRGIGESLLRTVQAYAASIGSVRLFLHTTPFLTSAIRLYERFGFRHVPAIGAHDLFGTPLLTMAYELRKIRVANIDEASIE
jgi:GNAT superfamily N-acetyltransferase